MKSSVSKWSDGTKKSTGNAFDWKNKGQSTFTKQDFANMRNPGRPNNYPGQVIAYSRAKAKKT